MSFGLQGSTPHPFLVSSFLVMPNTFPTLLLGLQSIQIKVRTAQPQWLRGGAGIDVFILHTEVPVGWRWKGMHPCSNLLSPASSVRSYQRCPVERGEGRNGFLECWHGTKARKDGVMMVLRSLLYHIPKDKWGLPRFFPVSQEPMCFMLTSPAHVYIAGRTLTSLSLTDIKKKIYVTYKKTTLQQEAVLFYEHPSSGNIKIVQFRQLIFPLETLECNIPGPLSLSFSLSCFHCTSLSCMKLPLRAQAAW